MPDKPFPWYCTRCKKATIEPSKQRYEFTQKHDGRTQQIVIDAIPIPTCTNCGYQTFDQSTLAVITEETYKQLGLLTPAEIRQNREVLYLKQQEMQDALGLGGNSLSRWETGHVYQSRALDRFLRVFFASGEARRILKNEDRTDVEDVEQVCLVKRCFSHIPRSLSCQRVTFRSDRFATAYEGN